MTIGAPAGCRHSGWKSSKRYPRRCDTWRLFGVPIDDLPSALPSGYVKIAIENHHRNSEFSHETWVIFHSYVTNYQRVMLMYIVYNCL